MHACRSERLDPASRDLVAAARAAQRGTADEATRSLKHAIADLEAAVGRILERQSALEEQQRKLERENAAMWTPLVTRTI